MLERSMKSNDAIWDIINRLNDITGLKFDLLHQSSIDGVISFDFIIQNHFNH